MEMHRRPARTAFLQGQSEGYPRPVRIRRWLLASGFAMSVAAGACSLTGLSDGAGTGPPLADGSSRAIESGSAPPDAGAHDASPPWCSHTFCDDFDHLEAGAFAVWDQEEQPVPGIAIDPDASASPPNSAYIVCDGFSACWMKKTFPTVNGMKFQLRAR